MSVDIEVLENYQAALDKLSLEISALKKLKSGESIEIDFSAFPDLHKLQKDNEKIKYRIGILERAIMEEQQFEPETPTTADCVGGLRSYLTRYFTSAIKQAFPEVEGQTAVVTEATKAQFGDFQCNSAMGMVQALKKQGKASNPRDIANKIVEKIPKGQIFEKLEIAGPGFINIHFNSTFIAKLISDRILNGVAPPKVTTKRVVVDFSSPNIAKQMHVGHLRSTIIGDSICRLLEFVGMDVLRLNHIGDWGTQFGMLIAHLNEKFPDHLQNPPALGDLQNFYKESKSRFDADDAFKLRAYDCVVKLQNYESDITKAWSTICDSSRKDIEEIYKRLDIKIYERGESFYHKMMDSVVQELEEKGLLVTEEGRKLMFPHGIYVPLTIVKSDGAYTYDTSDLAALRHRIQEERADWLIYVVDSGQSLHLQQLFAAAKQAGYVDPEKHRVEHIGFGLVLGEDRKKFKTRSGDTVKLTDLLDEGLSRAAAKLKDKERDQVLSESELQLAQQAVAYGCIKYADLSHNRQQDYVFSFDRMLDDRGNTAVYLLYMLTRARSIARNAGVGRAGVNDYVSVNGINFTNPRERQLALTILKFPDLLESLVQSLALHTLCEYLYELSGSFSDFYAECQCIEKEADGTIKNIHYERLALCEAMADTLSTGLDILGIKTVERM